MSAKTVKTAQARATIAARLIKTTKPYPQGYGLGRSFDDCFEMGDGRDVYCLLLLKAETDMELLKAMLFNHKHTCGQWAQDVLKATGLTEAQVFYRA
jgi:hypothetical protein